jgi:adenylate cyclase
LLIVSESEFNWAAVEREFKLAIEANPNDPAAHYFYALVFLQPQERYDEAIAEYRKALELDPLSAIINTNYGYLLMVARRFDEAREQYRRTLELDPTFRIALQRASELEAYLGNYSAARQLLIRAYPQATDVEFGSAKDSYYLARLKLESVEEDKILNSSIAYAMLGRKDEAFHALAQAMEHDPGDLPHWIRRPEFDSLHSDPRYAQLLHRMNFSQ